MTLASDTPLLDPGAEWASLIMSTLADAGVRDVVFSPGSRSTPFVLAASREPRLTLYEAVDERAGSFFALGQARVTGRPSLLLCTSGTAPAHYLPAVIEAREAYLPLLILSADRPLELQDAHAPQTIDQQALFGRQARAFVELGVAESEVGALEGLRRRVAQAVWTARYPEPGAVQLNVRARKPLEPREATVTERPIAAAIRSVGGRPLTQSFVPPRGLHPEARALLVDAVVGQRGLIVVGPQPLSPRLGELLGALAARTGFLLAGEATSQLRTTSTRRIDALLPVMQHAPLTLDVIVQVGPPPTSSAWEPFLARHSTTPRYVLAEHGWPDPRGDARAVITGDLDALLRELVAALPAPEKTHDAWQASVLELAHMAERNADENLAATGMSEASVARICAAQLLPGSLLMVGNSLPIRVVDDHVRALPDGVGVLSQRGANGIDGLVAGAAGAAATGRATTLLIGDVSLQHDLGGMAMAAHVRAPLTVVVLNNGGGRIFEQLPIGGSNDLRLFTTPSARDFAGAAQLFGWRYVRVDDESSLHAALQLTSMTPLLIDAHVPPSGAAPLTRAITQAFIARVGRP